MGPIDFGVGKVLTIGIVAGIVIGLSLAAIGLAILAWVS